MKSIVHDSHEAEDITQNVFAKLSTKIRKYEPRRFRHRMDPPRRAERSDRQPALPAAELVEEVRTDDERQDQIGFERSQSSREPSGASRTSGERFWFFAIWSVSLRWKSLAGSGKAERSIHGLHHRGRSALQLALLEMDAGPVYKRLALGVSPSLSRS